jgi:hypothetical protein
VKLSIFSRRTTEVDPERRRESDMTGEGWSGFEGVADGEHLNQHLSTDWEEGPGAREQRVAELRRQVRGGTYEIPVAQLVRVLAAIILRRK